MKRRPPTPSQQALARAFALQQAGRLDEAEAILRRTLGGAPRFAEALHLLALVRHQRGDLGDALDLLGAAVAAAPAYADAWRNLGNLRGESDDARGAEECFRRVLAIAPGDVPARGNLAVLLEKSGRVDEAIVELYALRRAAPRDVTGLGLLARLLRQSRRHEEEVVVAKELVRLLPGHEGLHKALSRSYFLWFDTVDRDTHKAKQVLAEWLAFDDQDPVARHMAAAHAAQSAPARAADAYVARHFDEFAATYDKVLDGLDNQGPRLIEEALRLADPRPTAGYAVADLGCGTGKCGPALRPFARRLVGVDLSQKMLDRARARGGYDELVAQEVTAFLEARPAAFDLMVCADTLPYFGDVGALFTAAGRSLRPGGRFLATAEILEASGDAFRLGVGGRYAHAAGYLTGALEAAAFTVERVITTDLRREYEATVRGLVLTARRPALDGGAPA